jgi:hypothetical protein
LRTSFYRVLANDLYGRSKEARQSIKHHEKSRVVFSVAFTGSLFCTFAFVAFRINLIDLTKLKEELKKEYSESTLRNLKRATQEYITLSDHRSAIWNLPAAHNKFQVHGFDSDRSEMKMRNISFLNRFASTSRQFIESNETLTYDIMK